MDNSTVKQIFAQFKQMRAFIIGDAMVDAYLWGNVERLSPEAPIPVVAVTQREYRLGGAANVALNIQALGAVPVLFTVIGNDDMGSRFLEIIKEKNLPDTGILTDGGRMTTVKSRIIGRGRHIARVDEESVEFIPDKIEDELYKVIAAELTVNPPDVVIFVDYDKGVITPALFRKVNRLAKLKGIPVTVDPKKRNFNVYGNLDLFKPNFMEFTEGTGIQLRKGDWEGLKHAALKFREKHNFRLIFITLSELGVFISDGEDEHICPAVVRQIADVSGAGDTVISVASLALAAKLPYKTIAIMSNLAGGLVCEVPGVVPVDNERLIELMNSQNF